MQTDLGMTGVWMDCCEGEGDLGCVAWRVRPSRWGISWRRLLGLGSVARQGGNRGGPHGFKSSRRGDGSARAQQGCAARSGKN